MTRIQSRNVLKVAHNLCRDRRRVCSFYATYRKVGVNAAEGPNVNESSTIIGKSLALIRSSALPYKLDLGYLHFYQFKTVDPRMAFHRTVNCICVEVQRALLRSHPPS